MFYWGEVSSLECGGVNLRSGNGFKDIAVSDGLTELSVTHTLLAFLTGEGKVTVVFLNGRRGTEVSGEGQRRTEASGEEEMSELHKRFSIQLKERIQFLSSGKSHVVLVSEVGTVWEWRYSEHSVKPRSFNSLTNRQISHVACGSAHSLVLAKDGHLFTWGQNSSGQLGLGEGEPSSLSPQPLKSLSGVPLAQISAGGDHSFALSLSGAVFSWGRNNTGQLGLGDRENRYVPVCVHSLSLKKTAFVSCGEDHTAVVTKGGVMFTFGSGCYGQLGHNSLRDELRPRLLAGLWGMKVFQIACGRYHTLALVGPSKTIYSFGCGEQGQLGNGKRTNQCVPLPVDLPPVCKPDQTVEKIIAGGNLSAACCQDGEIISASSCNGTSVLDDELIGKWILDCEKAKAWNRVKREIKRMFSSASCINGSFTDKSSDNHYKTSEGYSGLDLSLARLAFEKLAKKQKILSEVEHVVERDLLPSLGSTAAGVEALRVYLILPELLRVLNKVLHLTQLTVALASAILRLDPESLNVLRSLWTRLPYSYYRTLVKTFHSVAAHFMSQMTAKICNYWKEASPPLSVLQMLHDINSQRVTRLMDERFYIKELTAFFGSIPSLCRDQQGQAVLANILKNVDFFRRYPYILDTRSKCRLFEFFQQRQGQLNSPLHCKNSLCVHREALLADTLTYLRINSPDFSLPLKVTFSQEDGSDAGGLLKEFFRLLSQHLSKVPSMLQASEHSGLLWFSDHTSGTTDEFYYLGIICGMAFYNRCYMNIGFPLALFKKLLHLTPTLSDLEELSPVEARGLKDLLLEDEDVVEMLYLDFTVHGKELISNGREIPVTKINRQKYVDLYVDFVFNVAVEYQFKEFARGFSCGNYSDFWRMFLPEELRLLLHGTSECEWEVLQKIATYERCGPSDELIQNFWTVFFELSEEHKKMFLIFMYATDRLPVGGLSQLHLKIVRRDCEDADERFPVAQTCFGTLELPNYSNICILQDRLFHAITCCEVFGKI